MRDNVERGKHELRLQVLVNVVQPRHVGRPVREHHICKRALKVRQNLPHGRDLCDVTFELSDPVKRRHVLQIHSHDDRRCRPVRARSNRLRRKRHQRVRLVRRHGGETLLEHQLARQNLRPRARRSAQIYDTRDPVQEIELLVELQKLESRPRPPSLKF
eukprot:Amastigsp_a841353_258.p2 type:complete len:159 gc:universal Amastigsp_a841353_258:389-865(+)